MEIQWPAIVVRFTRKLLHTLKCFKGAFTDAPPPAAPVFIRPPVDEVLLPGLPNSLVLECILPRILWHARPLLKATSRAWSFALDGLSTSDRLRARTFSRQHNKDGLDIGDGNLVQVKHAKDCQYAIQLYDPGVEIWHNLPPIPCGSLPPLPVFAGFLGIREGENSIQVDYICGKMVAASVYVPLGDECIACVWTIDIEGGMWKWEERRSIPTKIMRDIGIRLNAMDLEGKIYILRHGMWDERTPIVYDVASDEWMQLQKIRWPPYYQKSSWVTVYFTRKVCDPDTGKFSKFVHANGPFHCNGELNPLTHTWKAYKGP